MSALDDRPLDYIAQWPGCGCIVFVSSGSRMPDADEIGEMVQDGLEIRRVDFRLPRYSALFQKCTHTDEERSRPVADAAKET